MIPMLALALAVAAPSAAHAAGAAGGHHHHGGARLLVAVDGKNLEAELVAPLDSLVGFEHAPRNEKERKALEAVQARFRNPADLLTPTAAAGCSPGPAEVQQSSAGGHAELRALIVFQCLQPRALQDIEVGLFDAFPRLRRLDAEIAVPGRQSAARLDRQRRRITWQASP
jgi:hypothetical protein